MNTPTISDFAGMDRDFSDSSTAFVYGTLRPGQSNFATIDQWVDVRDRARLSDFRLWALPQGYPTVLPGDGTVVGTLLGLDDEGRALKCMHRIEGYRPEGDSLYRPRRVDVETEDGRLVETFTYVITPRHHDRVRRRGQLVEDGDWIQWSTDRER